MKKIALALMAFSFVYAEPPRKIPGDLYDQFTLGRSVPVLDWYRDDSYTDDKPRFYSHQQIDTNIERIKRRETSYYGNTDTWLYEAFESYPIQGKTVGIIGSVEPWYESIVLAFGGIPYTIEYNKITTDDPRLNLMTVTEYESSPKPFDVVLSISSTEHDGLGRYGDPIDPNGDLKFMQKVKNNMLKPKGLLFLAVPFGQDCLVWNVHRIYGRLRFPLLTQGWNIANAFGFYSNAFDFPLGNQGYQPVFVLTSQ